MRTTKTKKTTSTVEKTIFKDKLIFGTTSGLVKKTNEDRAGYINPKNEPSSFRICLTDGHWGEEASEEIINFWLNQNLVFPKSRENAIATTKQIEKKLLELFGEKDMNAQTDFTPEAAFIVCEISKSDQLTIISYGDCRLLITNKQKIRYNLPIRSTWLGAFSGLGLRNRLSVENALIFERQQIQLEDYVFLFTDGIDECVYNTPTIPLHMIAKLTKKLELETIFNSIIEQVFVHGAEDNASLVIFKL